MAESISIADAQLISIILHTLLYGIYLIHFGGCIYVLVIRPRTRNAGKARPMNRTLFCVSIVFVILISLHWVIQVIELFETFRLRTMRKAPNTFYEYITGWKYIFTTAISGVEALVADGTMIYRLYHVWGGNWRVIVLPVLTGLSAFVVAIVAVTKLAFGARHNYFTDNLPWDVAFIALQLALVPRTFFVAHKVIDTSQQNKLYHGRSDRLQACRLIVFNFNPMIGMIAYRIWSVEKYVRASGARSNSRTMPVVAVIVESAAVITGILLIILIAFLTRSGDVQTIILDSLSPVIVSCKAQRDSIGPHQVVIHRASHFRSSSSGSLLVWPRRITYSPRS
ncbi:hypothetical protein HGRIS_014187 [Hohenbuehelia grisea]|uniref:Gustatory receptor n=1 Tax=Hohenbuehelia grisea TaxID=104357 RepID=A0ABR3JUT2_9AGAR